MVGQWFLQNVRYKRWIEDSYSGLDCGKSVLSKSLIEHEDRNESQRTIMFLRGRQRRSKKRYQGYLCSSATLLNHCEKPGLLKKAVNLFESNGTRMLASFLILWKLFLGVAQDQKVGEVICVLDALDECKEEGQEVLVHALNAFHMSIAETNGRQNI